MVKSVGAKFARLPADTRIILFVTFSARRKIRFHTVLAPGVDLATNATPRSA